MRSRWVLVKCAESGDGYPDGAGMGDGTSGWGHLGDGGDERPLEHTPYVNYHTYAGYEFQLETETPQ